MSELKTLKDLQILIGYKWKEDKKKQPYAETSAHVAIEDLKQEAIKWVNRYNKQNFKDKEPKVSADTLRWIKHFFNLTEEDL